MSCNDQVLYVRAGDVWTIEFRYTLDGQPEELPAGARLQVRDAGGNVLLTLEQGSGLTIDTAAGTIQAISSGADTLPLAIGGKRTELSMALKVFEPGAEDATAKTLVAVPLIALPRVVT